MLSRYDDNACICLQRKGFASVELEHAKDAKRLACSYLLIDLNPKREIFLHSDETKHECATFFHILPLIPLSAGAALPWANALFF